MTEDDNMGASLSAIMKKGLNKKSTNKDGLKQDSAQARRAGSAKLKGVAE